MPKGIYTRWAIPPVFLILWGSANVYSRGEILTRVMFALWSFLLTPMGRLIVMLIGFAWFALLWARPRFAWIERLRRFLPQTIEERLKDVESSHIPALHKRHDAIDTRINCLCQSGKVTARRLETACAEST